MAFLLRAFWGSNRQKESAKSAEVINQRFQAELNNIRSSLEVGDDELQSLVEMIYDSSFPESQNFLKHPSKERLKAHKDTLSSLLFGLAKQGVPATKLILEYTQKHGLDAIADTLITLLELVRPLLAAKEMPDFTSDDLLDAIDNQWHSSVRSSPRWGGSATQSPFQSPRGSVSMSPRGAMSVSPRSPFSIHSLSGKLGSPVQTHSLGSISPGKSASLVSYFRMNSTNSAFALPESSWDGTSGTPPKRSSPSLVAGSSGCLASLSYVEKLHPHEENEEELNQSVRFPEISRRQEAQDSEQLEGAQYSDRIRGFITSVPSYLSSSEKLEALEEDMVRKTREEGAECAQNERASYGLNMNKSSHMSRRSLSFEVFKDQGVDSPVKLPAEDTQMLNAQLSTVRSSRASYSLSIMKPNDSRRSLSFEVFKPKESPDVGDARNEQILQDKPSQSLSIPVNPQYSFVSGVVGDKDSLSDDMIIKDKSPSVAETEEHEVDCDMELENQVSQGSEGFEGERVVNHSVASKEFVKDFENEVGQRRSKQPYSDIGAAKGSESGEEAYYLRTLHVNSQESLETAHEIGESDQDHGAESSIAHEKIVKLDATVTLKENQVERDTFDRELSISAGLPLPLEEKVDDKEVVTSVADMEFANKDEGDEVLEPVHKAAKHVENVESEQPLNDKGIVYPLADVDVANRSDMDEEFETLYIFGGEYQQESAQRKPHEIDANCEDHMVGRIFASEDIAREYSAEPVEENEVKRDHGCWALSCSDVGKGPLPVEEETDEERVDRMVTMEKNEGEIGTESVHTYDVICLADSPQTVESMASQGYVCSTQAEDVRSVVSTTLQNQDFKQHPQEEDAERNNSSLHYKDDVNPVRFPVADLDHAGGMGRDEAIQAMLTSDHNSQNDSAKKPEEMVHDSESNVQAKSLATKKESADGDTVQLKQGEGHGQSICFCNDKEAVEEEVDNKGFENSGLSATPTLMSLENSLEKVEISERRTTCTMSKVPDIMAPSEENAGKKDHVTTLILLQAQSTADVSRHQRENGEAVVESIPDSFESKLEQFVTPGSLAAPPMSNKTVTVSDRGSRGVLDPISPEDLAGIPSIVDSSEENCHEADRNYPLQEIDDSKPENLLGCKVSRFRIILDVSDKGGHETDKGEACGNGNLLETSILASSGEELDEVVRPSAMMSRTSAKGEQGTGSTINEHVIAAREKQNAGVAGGGQQDADTVDPKQQVQNFAIELRELPNALEEKELEHKGQEEGSISQSMRVGQEDRDLSKDENKSSSSSSSSDSSSTTSSSSEADKGSVSSASSDTEKNKSSSTSVQSEDRENSGLTEHVTSDSELPVPAQEDVEGHKGGPGNGGFKMSPSIDEGGGSSTSMQVGEQEREGATKHSKRDVERVKHEDADFHESTVPSSLDKDGNYHQLTNLESLPRDQAYEQDATDISQSNTGGSLPVQPKEYKKVLKNREASPMVHVDQQEEVEASGIVSNGPNLPSLDHSFILVQAEEPQGDELGDKSGHPERQIAEEYDTLAKNSQMAVDNSETSAQIELEHAETRNSSRNDRSEEKGSAFKSHEGEEKCLVGHGRPEEQESSYGVSDPEAGSKVVKGKHSLKSITVGPSSLSPNLHFNGPGNPSMSWRDFVKSAYTSARESTSQLQIQDPHLNLPAQDGIEQPATTKSEENLEFIYNFEPTTSPRVHNDGNSAPHEHLAFDAMTSEVATSGQALLLPVEREKHQTDCDTEPVMSEQQRDRFNKNPGTSGRDGTPPLKNEHQSPTTHVQVQSETGEALDVGHIVGSYDSDHEPSTSAPIRDEDDTGVDVQESNVGKISIEALQTSFSLAEPVGEKLKQASRNLQENLPNDQGTRGVTSGYRPNMQIGGSKSVQHLGDGHSENGSGQTQALVVTGVATYHTEVERSHGALRTASVTTEPVKMETQPAASDVPGAIIPVGQEARGSRRLQDLKERNHSNDLIGTHNSKVAGAETLESVPSSGAEPERAAREALVHPSSDDQMTDANVPDQTQLIEEESAETREKAQLVHTSYVPARSQEAFLGTGESEFLAQGIGSTNVHLMDETESKVPGEISLSEGSREKEDFFSYSHAPVQPIELGTTEVPIYTREAETDEETNGSNSAQNMVEATDKKVSGCTQISELAVAQQDELLSHVAPVEGVEVGPREAPLQRARVPDDEGVSGRNSAIDLVEGAHRNGFVIKRGATRREKIELFSSPLVAADFVEVGDGDPTLRAGANGIDTRQTGVRNDAQVQQQEVHEYEGTKFADDPVAKIAENMKQNLVEIPRIQSAPQQTVGIAIKDAERATLHQEMQSGSNSMPGVLQSLEETGTETRETTSQTRHMSIVEGSSKELSLHFPPRKVKNALQSSENFDASNLENDLDRWPGRASRTVDTAELGDSKTRTFLQISNGMQKVERRDKDNLDGNEIFEKKWTASQKESGGLGQLSLKHPIGAGDTKVSEISTKRHSSAVPLSTTRQESSPLHHQPKYRSGKRRQRRWKFFFCCSPSTTL